MPYENDLKANKFSRYKKLPNTGNIQALGFVKTKTGAN